MPLYLAAYNATLSHADQRILKVIYRAHRVIKYWYHDIVQSFQILRYYEAHGVKLRQYWPYLWGSAAATRYSVKGETDTVLWRQPSTSEIFNLFDKDIVNETIRNYPIHRTLEVSEYNVLCDTLYYIDFLSFVLCEMTN